MNKVVIAVALMFGMYVALSDEESSDQSKYALQRKNLMVGDVTWQVHGVVDRKQAMLLIYRTNDDVETTNVTEVAAVTVDVASTQKCDVTFSPRGSLLWISAPALHPLTRRPVWLIHLFRLSTNGMDRVYEPVVTSSKKVRLDLGEVLSSLAKDKVRQGRPYTFEPNARVHTVRVTTIGENDIVVEGYVGVNHRFRGNIVVNGDKIATRNFDITEVSKTEGISDTQRVDDPKEHLR